MRVLQKIWNKEGVSHKITKEEVPIPTRYTRRGWNGEYTVTTSQRNGMILFYLPSSHLFLPYRISAMFTTSYFLFYSGLVHSSNVFLSTLNVRHEAIDIFVMLERTYPGASGVHRLHFTVWICGVPIRWNLEIDFIVGQTNIVRGGNNL